MLLRIGTRGSTLALVQSGWVRDRVMDKYPDVEVELVRIRTKGDKILDSPLSKIGGKGLFVKEIEDALLREEIDLAVHSIKDVPAELPEYLCLSIFPEREDPRDALVSERYESIDTLPEGAAVGTGSLRRAAQLLSKRPDLRVIPIRGNVDTRIKKMESGDLQAVILAAAGLRRLGLSSRIRQSFSPNDFLPAIGQGALGIEVRENDESVLKILRFLNHEPTEVTVRAERAFLKELEGGCQVPIAAHCRLDADTLTLVGMVAELDGSRVLRDEVAGNSENPEATGLYLARRLLESGAQEILARVYGRD